MANKFNLDSISDEVLLRRLSEILKESRRVEVELVAHIGEVDQRRLYARSEASPSMFVYCTERLHLSAAETYLRLAVARAARKHPAILPMLEDGRLHLSGIAKLAPVLTEANCESLLDRATHNSKRKIEELVADVAPKPDVPSTMRKLPAPREPSKPAPTLEFRPDAVEAPTQPEPAPPPCPAPVKPAVVEPLAPSRYRVQFTAGAELREKLEVVEAFDLRSRIAPFTRCLKCSGTVREVDKAEVERQLPKHTRREYDHFLRCESCASIYWPGAHFARLRALVDSVRNE